jgi:LmbE family N-acetylglucosaminyl deacetylase
MQIGSVSRLENRLLAGLSDETFARASSSAVVFAPHQDDETLGCGGTMALKAGAAVPLNCVFMTDGATSHQAWMDRDELRRTRKIEALEATAVLGLRAEHVMFLDFPDSQLSRYHREAVAAVTDLLTRLAPQEVYVPYEHDGTPDHEATYRVVIEALREVRSPTRILEYPVWFWNRWPWVPLPVSVSRSTMNAIGAAVGAGCGRQVLREFRSGVRVENVLGRKREALARHRSQMSVLRPGTAWPTLHDVSDGEFLKCFFRDYEVFRCTEAAAR